MLATATAAAVQALERRKFIHPHEAVLKSPGERAPDDHVRIAPRWMKHEQLMRHGRAMVSPAKTGSLKSRVTKAWKKLEAQG